MNQSKKQSGFVLITSIIFLIAITIAVVYAVKSATIVEHSAGNNRARSQAFEMAQLSLHRAQAQLTEEITFPNSGCVNGLCNKNTADSILLDKNNWQSGTTTCDISATACNKILGGNKEKTLAIQGVAAQPRWAVRDLANNTDGDCTFYEVWAQGTGAEANSSVLIRSIVKACES